MILDGVYYRAAIDHQKEKPDEALIRARLANYQKRNITYLRDGGDAWGVGELAAKLANEYGIAYRTPCFNICRAGHYGGFLGRSFSDFAEYRSLLEEVKERGGHFVKIMVSGLMDFDRFGILTDEACPGDLQKDMIAAAHDMGFSVMAHANGSDAVSRALAAGVDSVEHGAYLEKETLSQLAESSAVWVPTLVTVGNLRGEGRYPDSVLEPLLKLQQENVAYAAGLGAKIALGTDAGAYRVYHGEAVSQEYVLLREALEDQTDTVLQEGEKHIREKF